MTEAQVRGLFALAGIEILSLKELINGYGGHVVKTYAEQVVVPRSYREGETLLTMDQLEFLNCAVPAARSPWWFVRTPWGWVEVGWRKRVIAIDWSETSIRAIVTLQETTKSETGVHAWSEGDAVTYLKTWAQVALGYPDIVATRDDA